MMQTKKFFSLTVIFGVLVILDQISKYLAYTNLKSKPVIIIPDVFELHYLENTGAAWGMLAGKIVLFTIITIIIMAALVILIHKLERFEEKKFLVAQIVLTVLLAGALGNLIDRLVHGYVIDYFYFKLINFPIFNVADCYVTISVAIILIMLLFVFKEDEIEKLFSRNRREEDKN